jgi:hypothetical protein
VARKIIKLYDLGQLALIVDWPSGVIYRNQVGGNVCAQEEQEGVLVPLDFGDEVLARIEELPYPNGRQGITVEIADALDEILAAQASIPQLSVDRAKLDESQEAWVHVRFGPCRPYRQGEVAIDGIFGFDGGAGVLTWINSD